MINKGKSATNPDQVVRDFTTIASLLRAVEKDGRGNNACPICEKTFERFYNLKVHLRKHTGETPYDCPVSNCGKRFKWRSSMAHHVRAHHQATKQPNEDDMNVQVMECESLLNCIKPSKKRSTYKSTNDTPYALKEGVKKSIKSKSLKSSKGVKDQSDSVIIEESAEQLRLSPPFESSSIYQIVEEQMKTGAGIETEGKLLEVMSELFTKDCDMLFQNGDTIPGMQLDMAADHLDHGLFFLAASSDDVTDAEMESLAQFGQNLAASTSKETTATCSIDTSVVP